MKKKVRYEEKRRSISTTSTNLDEVDHEGVLGCACPTGDDHLLSHREGLLKIRNSGETKSGEQVARQEMTRTQAAGQTLTKKH